MGSDGHNHRSTTFVVVGLAAVVTAAAVWYATSRDVRKGGAETGGGGGSRKASRSSSSSPAGKDAGSVDSGSTPTKSNVASSSSSSSATAATASTRSADDDDKALHRRIEEIDRAGKALFKEKRFVEAAETFTEALDLIESSRHAAAVVDGPPSSSSSDGDGPSNNNTNVARSSLTRQIITLMNNRSAMYEKASLPDLALSDCDSVLALDPGHSKARTRRLRILESQDRHAEALVEVCALQLKFMHDNRDKLRLGLPPAGNPPVSQSKIEELVTLVQPGEIERARAAIDNRDEKDRPLPSTYTISQLLTSFSGYNKWMGEAARGGTTSKFTSQLEDLLDHVPRRNMVAYADNVAMKSTLLLHRGRRYAFEKDYARAVKDFEDAFALVEDEGGKGEVDHGEVKAEIVKAMEKDDYARLLEWSGMCKHLRYELKGALGCYERCSALEPENTELLVKRAGVKMDEWDHAGAEVLFTDALALNPTASDALLHRANMRMLQQRVPDSQKDLETCIRLYPNNMLARLRLATVFMAKEDMDGAKRMLDQAEEYDPNSSEVHCYRGELHFARGEFVDAKGEFEKSIRCDPTNPTPYVNAALALVNIEPASGSMMPPDFAGAIKLLEKAIEVDPMMHGAYVQLGQMKLSMATDLTKAKEVVNLYDKALEYCRSPEELKDICSMRILTVAQIDAAHALHMETLKIQ
ncbi:hypothetical protein ACHAW5_010901 [Stephanodiscus triporus]|uniref:Mitochondrial import receptor subunit TOM70 n=1 Tax=Stephanodiscus triporus TaxID=2934178 RepID=A0ABD3NH46_9STRA